MGETIAKIKVTSLVPNGALEFQAVVDTGATYTALPKDVLTRIGIQSEDQVDIELADGRTASRSLANVWIELEGRRRANTIVLGEFGDAIVVGLLTLESCALSVDPVNRKLVPVPKVHHY